MKAWKTEFTCNNGNHEEAITLVDIGVDETKNGHTFRDTRACISTHYFSDGTQETRSTRLGNVPWTEVVV